jgi:peptide/nickel transport system permease protein
MVGFLINRLLHAVAVLWGVVSVTFALLHLAGDPLAGLIPPGAAPEIESQIRTAYGLDRPLPEQYLDFEGRAMRGDFGDSWRQGRPALEAVLERLPATLWLTAVATTLAVALASFLGVSAAARPGSAWDIVARSTALLGQAVPAFWLGTMLILLFAVALQWLPSSGLEGPGGVILPALSLAAYPAATLTRLLRASMMETLGADYIRTARAKGLSRSGILIGHALRNAVIVEGVFAYPGIGGLALDAVAARDIPLVEAFVWVVAVMILVANLLTGVLAMLLDPRLREDGLTLGSAAS